MSEIVVTSAIGFMQKVMRLKYETVADLQESAEGMREHMLSVERARM